MSRLTILFNYLINDDKVVLLKKLTDDGFSILEDDNLTIVLISRNKIIDYSKGKVKIK